MRRIGLVTVLIGTLVTFAFAQKGEIDVVNARWTDLFNKGDFAGLAMLYTDDATAFLPGAEIARGAADIGRMWKGIADQVSEPKLVTLEVKTLTPSATRELTALRAELVQKSVVFSPRHPEVRRLKAQIKELEKLPVSATLVAHFGTFSLKSKGRSHDEINGRFVQVWEKIGSDWKLAADIWNQGK